MTHLHLDFETFSSVDIRTSGVYKYTESVDFEILMIAYSFNDETERIIDLAAGEEIPKRLIEALVDPKVLLFAHNATFERLCLRAYGFDIHPDRWRCSQVKAAYCGLPQSLKDLSKVMQLGEDAKDAKGEALIRFFSVLVKPTKTNGMRTRNLWYHNSEKHEEFKDYCIKDVKAEKAVLKKLEAYKISDFEQRLYSLDQRINDRGVSIDLHFAKMAVSINQRISDEIKAELKELTGLSNPNSPDQLKDWLSLEMKKKITSLTKDTIPELIKEAGSESVAGRVLSLRLKGAKTSVKKYVAMLNCFCYDLKAHGLLQFYGAGRTGRWAGRLIQVQNLPKNSMADLARAREFVRSNRYEELHDFPTGKMLIDEMLETESPEFYGVPTILSQLIRTAFVPSPGKIFGVADFSAIEARVIAWLADEKWRLHVFNTHGMIYEASAAMMYNVDINTIQTLDAEGNKVRGENFAMRAKGKVAELALGYQGGRGAMLTMGAEAMGLSNKEIDEIVSKFREANPNIKALWEDMEKCAILAVKNQSKEVSDFKDISFEYDGAVLMVTLPSGRQLIYQDPKIERETKHEVYRRTAVQTENGYETVTERMWLLAHQVKRTDQATGKTWKVDKLTYMGMDQTKKIWRRLDTYGGKLVENIVQAIARDILAESMLKLDAKGFEITMHIHDEVVIDLDRADAEERLEEICQIMSEPIEWAEGLPLAADGYLTEFYKKDD